MLSKSLLTIFIMNLISSSLCDDECGLVYQSQNAGKIVGGSVATAHSWPASVYIIFSYKKDVFVEGNTITVDYSSSCGGTLISRRVVLTAAHCIPKNFSYTHNAQDYEESVEPNSYYPTIGSMFKVYLGFHDVSTIDQNNYSPAIKVSINDVIVHEEYDDANNLNDIAILKFSNEIELNENIQISCLPTSKSSTYPSLNSAWIVGWGTTSPGGSTSDQLKNAKINIYSSSSCNSVLPSFTKNWNAQICAGEIAGGEDTCQGDSGGSLYVRDTVDGKTKFVTAGIVSYGDGCGDIGKPGIYTRVSYYYDWIKKNHSSNIKCSIMTLSSVMAFIKYFSPSY